MMDERPYHGDQCNGETIWREGKKERRTYKAKSTNFYDETKKLPVVITGERDGGYGTEFDSFLCSVESVIDFAHSLLCTHAGRIVKLGIPSRCCTILCVASTAIITYAPPHLLFTWVSVTYKHSHLRRHFGVHTLMQI